MFRHLVKRIRIEEWVALGIFFAALCADVLLYGQKVSVWESVMYAVRYFTFGDQWYWLFFLSVYFYIGWQWYRFATRAAHRRFVDKQPIVWPDKRKAFSAVFHPVRALLPIALPAAPLSALLSDMSFSLRFSGQDVWFWFADQTVFGTQLFIALAHFFAQSPWLTSAIFFSYIHLGLIFNGVLIFLFFAHRKLFRHLVLSFMLSMAIAFPIFYAMPCQDPYNFFVRNIRAEEFPVAIGTALAAYEPSAKAEQYMTRISRAESVVEQDNRVPISCFPSMHAVWSIFVVYFLARVSRRTLFLTLPWMCLLLLGGLYFAQHYGVDYLVGGVVAVCSLWVSSRLLKMEMRRVGAGPLGIVPRANLEGRIED